VTLLLILVSPAAAAEPGLIGHWKLQGDARDSSGAEHHGTNHGAMLESGTFDGRRAFVEIPTAPDLGKGDFTISVQTRLSDDFAQTCGDILSQYDSTRRRGFHLGVSSSAGGYNGAGSERHVHFGMDDGTEPVWDDCGRPGGQTHISDALTVFNGHLYAGTTDAIDEKDWAHVFRYDGGRKWEDCGRLGTGKTRGVYAMVVHGGALHAATSSSHGKQPATMGFGRVYRYRGGQEWEDLGQPGENYRLNALASFRGKLYVCGFNIGTVPGYVYEYEGNKSWRPCGEFNGWPHTLAVHQGRLFTGYPQGEVYSYDGSTWTSLGNPLGNFKECSQIHALNVFRGELIAGSWPKGRVSVLREGKWVDAGQPGDATEVIGLTVYHGGLYSGTIPRAEVLRYAEDAQWTSLRRLFDPPGYEPVPVGSGDKRVEDWSRATSLTPFDGKLYVSTGTCYRTRIESLPADDVRGKVLSLEVGAGVTDETDLGSGWKHLVVVRDANRLQLFVNGKRKGAKSLEGKNIELSSNRPLRIGFGQSNFFEGNIRDVRVYNRGLTEAEIGKLAETVLH
jgi:hypothetical protein